MIPVRFPKGPGSFFVSTEPPAMGSFPPLPDCCDDKGQTSPERMLGWVSKLWGQTLNARHPEIARLRMLERLYRGIHYKDIQLNRALEITNHCFAQVETVWSQTASVNPEPQVRPLRPLATQTTEKLAEFGHWLQSSGRMRHTRRVSDRVKLKYGYSIILVTVDPVTGMPFAIDWSPFDWYPDPSARNILNAEYFFLAAPVATRRLQSWFPDQKKWIKPDNYTSPMYDVTVLADYALYHDAREPVRVGAYATNQESTAPYQNAAPNYGPQGGTRFASLSGEQRHTGSDTTFFIQLLIRDHSATQDRIWSGQMMQEQYPGDPNPLEIPGQFHTEQVPACPSGWRLIQCVEGRVLDDQPLDECFLGLPFVIDYDYEHESRLYGMGEQDQIAPLNRGINERKNSLNRSLRLQASPVTIATKGSGIDFNRRGVEPGDVLDPTKGSQVSFLDYQGPHPAQFEHLQVEYRDIEIVGGAGDAIRGQRPAGIEAGVAIQSLQEAAAARVQSKMPGAMEAWSQVLRKMCAVASKKLISPIMFKATNGEMMQITPEELAGAYEFYFDPEQSKLYADRQHREEVLTMYTAGLLTPKEALKELNWPNYDVVAAELEIWKLREAMAASGMERAANPAGPQANGKTSRAGSRG